MTEHETEPGFNVFLLRASSSEDFNGDSKIDNFQLRRDLREEQRLRKQAESEKKKF